MKKRVLITTMTIIMSLAMSIMAFADEESIDSENDIMPYKAIVEQYNEDDYLRVEYLGDQIIEGDDYYEFPDCELTVDVYYDTDYVESKSVGDYIFVNGANRRIYNIVEGENKYYDLGEEDEDAMFLSKRDKGYICGGMDDVTERTVVYEGPVRFSKDAIILTGFDGIITTPQSYFFEFNNYGYSVRQYGYKNYYFEINGIYTEEPAIELDGYIATDDNGYITWYKEHWVQ